MNITRISGIEKAVPSAKITGSKKDIKTMNDLIDHMAHEEFGSYHSIYDMIENAKRTEHAVYDRNGLPIEIDTKNHVVSLNGARPNDKSSIVVTLKNGYSFSFSKDNILAVREMLDLFCPEDMAKILAAISEENYTEKKKIEIEEDLLSMGEAAAKDKYKKKDKFYKEQEENRNQDLFKKMAADTVSGRCLYDMKTKEASKAKLKQEQTKQKLEERRREQEEEISDDLVKRLLLEENEI